MDYVDCRKCGCVYYDKECPRCAEGLGPDYSYRGVHPDRICSKCWCAMDPDDKGDKCSHCTTCSTCGASDTARCGHGDTVAYESSGKITIPITEIPDGADIAELAGVKHDAGKLQWSLIPGRAQVELVRVLTYGAHKYSPEGWREVRPLGRYVDAAHRHLSAWQMGEREDQESGIHHLAHAVCNLMFLLEIELGPEKKASP